MISLLLFIVAAPAVPASSIDTAWSVLEYGVKESSSDRRVKAIRALGMLKDNRRAQKLVEPALKDSTTDVRVEAAAALGRMHAVSAAPKLKEALKDNEISVVLSAADALYELKDPAAYDVYYAVLTGRRKSTQGLLQTQLAMLRNRKALEKLAFETGIGFVPFGSIGYEAWKRLTSNDSALVKAAAALKLAQDPDAESERALVNACDEDDWQVRAAAAQAIAQRGNRKLLSVLTPLFNDSNDAVRYESAASAIWLYHHPHRLSRGKTTDLHRLKTRDPVRSGGMSRE